MRPVFGATALRWEKQLTHPGEDPSTQDRSSTEREKPADMGDMPRYIRMRQPVFGALPSVVLWLTGAIGLISGAALLAGENVNALLIDAAAVAAGDLSGVPTPPRLLGDVAPYVLHVFAHAGWAHLLLNLAALLAFGGAVARRFGHGPAGAVSFLALFLFASVGGALTESIWQSVAGVPSYMVGASTGVSGLIAGAVYVMRAGYYGPLPAPWSATYLTALSPWLLINVAIGVAGFLVPDLGGIAWMGHIGGIVIGAVMFPLIDSWAQSQRPWAP